MEFNVLVKFQVFQLHVQHHLLSAITVLSETSFMTDIRSQNEELLFYDLPLLGSE